MENNDFEQIIKEAVNWWIEKIDNPNSFDNGDSSKEGQMANMLAILLAAKTKNKIEKEQIEIFRDSLTEKLENTMNLYGECKLYTDYEPMWELQEAAQLAQIDDSVFPWKTKMKISKDKIEVSEGYGKPYETIYKANDKTKTMKR